MTTDAMIIIQEKKSIPENAVEPINETINEYAGKYTGSAFAIAEFSNGLPPLIT